MIIKLPGADFSANNIGNIILPRELDPFTIAAIEASGNQAMTAEQKDALDVFFKTIGAFGSESEIWSKLDKVYLPFICSALANSFVNYKDNVVDCVPDDSWLELRNHGVGQISGSTKGTSIILSNSNTWNWANKSVFVLNAETIRDGYGIGAVNYKSTYGTTLEQIKIYGVSSLVRIDGNYDSSNSLVGATDRFSNLFAPSLKGISCDGTNYIVTSSNGSVVSQLESGVASHFNNYEKDLIVGNAASGAMSGSTITGVSCGALILGSYLNKTEFDTLVAATNALWAEFVPTE